ncbi:type II toxin-antitoxin system prevent-host-death family antitoxin [Streptomyces sp. NBC_00249]|uniref:type II toxin-antitoxin system prevent-host-death family antitoxin n=1 Tax=Streptomyces sp. NBC_00249 TaxID=2975690 RepID=UPI002250ED9B|nr:type II toxin-antitoxin system prevent-host-death family antitoxin [Streptomyces sp. NBC_00249]MCX5194634.1 type II toxin-antitoxin system prevent-host-death family antitoxin [Streptomyces sp. NBC_00249]
MLEPSAEERADRNDAPSAITRRGKQLAAVVSIETLRDYREWEDREINRIINERMASPAAGIPARTSWGNTDTQ